MRQIVSLVKDNQAHYALVDEEDGSIIPFADLLIPDPERFGLHESALLGTNLVAVLGLNGSKRPKARNYRVGEIQPGTSPQQQLELDVPATPTLPPAADKRGPGRPPGKNKPQPNRAKPDPAKRVQRYIPLSEITAVVNAHPEGLTAKEIATAIDGNDPPAHWVLRTVENRLASAEAAPAPTPFRVDRTQKGQTGPKRVVYPLG